MLPGGVAVECRRTWTLIALDGSGIQGWLNPGTENVTIPSGPALDVRRGFPYSVNKQLWFRLGPGSAFTLRTTTSYDLEGRRGCRRARQYPA